MATDVGFQEIDMDGVVYEFPSDMKDEDIQSALQKESFKGDGKANAQHTLDKSFIPRGVKLHNPGNIKFNPENDWKGQLGVEKHANPTFVQFDKPESGIRAMHKLLRTYSKRGQNTFDTIFRGIKQTDGSRVLGYTPDTENDTTAYIKDLVKRSGLSEGTEIDPENLEQMMALLPAMVHNEQGYAPYKKDMYEGVLKAEGLSEEEVEVAEGDGEGEGKGSGEQMSKLHAGIFEDEAGNLFRVSEGGDITSVKEG